MSWLYLICALVAIQRIAEALYAERNARRLLRAGAVESAPEQHIFFIVLHSAWLIAVIATTPRYAVPNWPLLALFAFLQIARLWVLATLGPYWTTKIISPPDVPPVRSGPYHWVKHPNYAIVAGEILTLPLAFGNVAVAAVFSVLNAALLAWRIRAENNALAMRASSARNNGPLLD